MLKTGVFVIDRSLAVFALYWPASALGPVGIESLLKLCSFVGIPAHPIFKARLCFSISPNYSAAA